MNAASASLNSDTKITFIGAGNMARSIIGGLIAEGHTPSSITATSPMQTELDSIGSDFAIRVSTDNSQAISGADVIVLAIKPQVMSQVCNEIAPSLNSEAVVISIAAGINCTSLQTWLGSAQPIVRCMPNTPALVCEGASGLYANTNTSDTQRKLSHAILASVGKVSWVEEENLIDSVTAVSGSGPAYFFLMMEAMVDAGIKQGLSKDVAATLTIQTALGAAKLAGESDVDLAELRRRVTSPNGTTEKAIESFENNHLRTIVDGAMDACRVRAEELAKELGA